MMAKTSSKQKGSPYKQKSTNKGTASGAKQENTVVKTPDSINNPGHSRQSSQPSNEASTMTHTASLQQQRAKFALESIHALKTKWQNDVTKQKEFNSHASAMPFMIRANGLGQTAAFYRRKGSDDLYFEHYKLLGEWLAKPGRPFAGSTDLLEAITSADLESYLAAQVEALLFLDWVKKLASGFLAREDEGNANQGDAP